MATPSSASSKSTAESRAEALQALLSSISLDNTASEPQLTPEQISRISDKLDNLLGEASKDVPQGDGSELLNEEGLPIIDITEPVAGLDNPTVSEETFTVPDTPITPLPTFALSDEERARERAEMDKLFDALEEEEEIELARDQEREQQRLREEHERRKANAAKELERLRKAKEMQRKMGKALLGGSSEESSAVPAAKAEEENVEKSVRPGKKVAFAEGTADEKPGTSTPTPGFRAVHSGQPMKFQVVERRPAKPSPNVSLPPPATQVDSDDESAPGSPVPADSDDGGAIHSDHESPSTSEHEISDDELEEDPVLEDDIDIDEAAHQREVALAYYEKRAAMGRDAARAMSAHTHEPHDAEHPGEHEWDQPDVPLEATLSHPAPQSASRFKSSRVQRAFNTSVPNSAPSTSLGGSILPEGTSVKSAVRLGKLDGDKLVGGEDGESGSDPEDDGEDVREFMNALRRGDVTNAGTIEANTDALMATLYAAYGAPAEVVKESVATLQSTAAATSTAPGPSVQAPAPITASSLKPKTSRFKVTRNTAPRTSSYESPATTPLSTEQRSSPKLPTGSTVIERKRTSIVPSIPPGISCPMPPARGSESLMERISRSSAATPPAAVTDAPAPPPTSAKPSAAQAASVSPAPASSAPADKPWLRAPERGAEMPSMIVDSPSFAPPPTSNRPQRPPTIVSSAVLERKPKPSTGGTGASQFTRADASPAPAKVSRFKANRS